MSPKIVFQFTKVLVLFSLLISCSTSEKKLLHGKIIDFSGEDYTLYLIKPEKLNEVAASYLGVVVDSASIETDGSFNFKNMSKVSESTLFELVIQPNGEMPNKLLNENPLHSNYMPMVLGSDEEVYVEAQLGNFLETLSIKQPSPINQALVNLRDIRVKAYKEFLQGKEWDVEDGSQLLDKEKAQLDYQRQLIDFANETSLFVPAMVALRWVSPENDYERIPEFLFNQCEKWKNTTPNPWIDQLCEQSKKSSLPVLIGDTFPNATVPLISGEAVQVNDVLGDKLTIIDLWASWCAPCRKENRDILFPLWKKYNEQGLQILAYGLESDKPAWEAAIQKDNAQYWLHASHLQGDDNPFLKQIRVQVIPANFILDSEGKVLAKNLHGKELTDFVENYIKN